MPDDYRHTLTAAALILFGLGLGLPRPALAHTLRVFAAAEGDLITGSAYFAGGAAAGGATVTIQDAQGRTLATPTPDAGGRFSYRAPGAMDLRVVAETADGHRSEWQIPAADLDGAFGVDTPAAGPDAPPRTAQAAGAPTTVARTLATPAPVSDAVDQTLETAIERAVARQVRPLRAELQAAQDHAELRDLLGAFGYIVGLAGLALWWDARKRGRPPERPSE